jgi:nucleoside-diphosphate-sugar epimerase
MPDTVLVTGGTGFVAQHCALQLLHAGYHVRTTVRDGASATVVLETLAAHVDPAIGAELGRRVEVVVADLVSDEGWPRATAQCRYVLHVASPVPLTMPRDADDVITPARDGTLRVLSAARDAGVERVVVTSSIAAIGAGRARDHVFTEADWSDLSSPYADAYARAKTLAERATWQFVDDLADSATLSVATICPCLVLGPLLGAR